MSENSSNRVQFSLLPDDNERLLALCGQFDDNLKHIERRLGVEVATRGNQFQITGSTAPVQVAAQVIHALYEATRNEQLTPERVHLALQEAGMAPAASANADSDQQSAVIRIKRGVIKPRGENQQTYLRRIQQCDINFGIGPAGTGKTYLAVAAAVSALEKEEVRRLILARPAVEAGEKLGFLPGDIAQKVDPYLRPLYDALYEMLGFDRVARLIERQVIEVAPLAFMRGRTLNDAFIILDEAQNTTTEQIKMFLTRVGFGSRAVITGDITQIDLPRGRDSGLRQVLDVLREVEGISFTFFTAKDVVRHPLVQRIVQAYEAFESGPGGRHD
ncbi:PhoH family protein [Candidatus Methylospira mobilis]|uniref:PhoH family protein n=1 Tax=Candidatus Methylospira mobilis TaxID=1808979 RepID=UPI0028EDBBDD|nr:PhoH family protein [Candidatus Methylospira mobilis]WNV04701.1 PhoH family protein [Candidatus Methylospira mobilis]